MNAEQGVCAWAMNHPLEREYHDKEWGRAVHDDTKLFEFLTLEGAQAGLSWLTVLKKREGYRQAFLGMIYSALHSVMKAMLSRSLPSMMS